jgi:diguanylate cyclase (GGDEF)-like protein
MTKAESTHVTMKPDQKFNATATQDDTATGGQSETAGSGQARARTSHGPAVRTGLVRAMGLLLVAYVAGLALYGARWGLVGEAWFNTVVNGWLGELVLWAPAVVCWMAVYRVGLRRPEVLFAAGAVTAFAAGDTYYTVMTVSGGSLPYPSLADGGYLLVYPLMLAALAVTVRRYQRGFASWMSLDAAVGFLGAATVLAVLLRPVLDSTTVGPRSLATVVAAAYPLFDLLLAAAVVGIAALRDVSTDSRWGLLAAGLLVFAAADVVYALQVSAGTYVLGTPLDAGWALGLVLMALWVDGTARREPLVRQKTRATTAVAVLAVPVVATTAALGVLVMDIWKPQSALAQSLAVVTLLVAAARTWQMYGRLSRMADLRAHEASTDPLTGLANRQALYTEGPVLLADKRSQRRALLLLDLDKFKEVNDSLGHDAGDRLLVEVAARLRDGVRDGDLLARLGGDEFAVLLQDAGHEEATAVAVKLQAALAERFVLNGMALHSAVSVGIALFPAAGHDLSALLRKADIALYKAKTASDGIHVYGSFDDNDGAARLRTADELRTAMTSDQLVLYYQPKISLDTGEVHGVEALVRWDHPTRGLLYPDAFLALVEESGLMRALTRLVLEMALDQAAVWQGRGQELTVAVNLSASSLVDADLPEQIAAMLAARGVPPRALQLEITEEFLMVDRDRARNILTLLRESGVQISVDDFGTGYSSLSYLRELPVDELKLDQSFVFPMADDARAAALVASTIDLAHSLGLRMVAEGVENDIAYTELTRLGCDQAQGYFISRPVPAAELDYWLSNRHAGEDLTKGPRPRPTGTQAGFDSAAITGAVAGVAAIEADRPRLAVLDLPVPNVSGIKTVRPVRASVSTQQITLQIARAIRAASDTQQALDVMSVALGEGLGVDRVVANTVGVDHQVQLGAQWHRPNLRPLRDPTLLPDPGRLAEESWLSAGFQARDDFLEAGTSPQELGCTFHPKIDARALIMVPIGLDDRVIGMICVLMVREPRAWTIAEINVVQAVAGLVARSIREVEQQANQREHVDRLERLNRQKSDFLATVSHELRTPLTSISGYVELLQGQETGELTAQQHRMLGVISRNAVRLRSLIEDLLVLSRTESGVNRTDHVEVSVRALITRVGEDLSLLARGCDIVLEIDAGPQAASVLGDLASLERAVVNIVSNAIKFSRPGGVVTIKGTLDQGARRVLVICQDNGIGIPAQDLADLFTRFFRASNATDQAIPGAGLGLSITKQIVEAHRGELRLTSVEEEGTTVVMDLPMYQSRHAVSTSSQLMNCAHA